MNPADHNNEIVDLPALRQLETDLKQAAQVRRRPQRQAGGRLIHRPFVVAVASLCLIALVVTPTGRSFAGDLGELVGIGDKPAVEQHASNERASVVIGVGTAPNGQHFEIAASRFEAPAGQPDDVCISLDFPGAEAPGPGPCLTKDSRATLQREGIGRGFIGPAPSQLTSDSDLIVAGLTSSQARGVSVTYEDPAGQPHKARAIFAELTPALANTIGSDETLGVYFAFIPDGVLPASANGWSEADRHEAAVVLNGVEAVVSGPNGEQIGPVPFDPDRDLELVAAAARSGE